MIAIKDSHNYFIIPKCAKSTDSMLVLGMNAPEGNLGPDGHYTLGPVQLMKPDKNDPRTTWRLYSAAEDGTWYLLNNAFIVAASGTGILTAPYSNSPVVMAFEFDIRGPDYDHPNLPGHKFRPVPQGNKT